MNNQTNNRSTQSRFRSLTGSALIVCAVGLTGVGLAGCATIAVTAAAVTALDIAYDRRTTGEYIDDATMELTVRQRLVRDPNIRGRAHVSATAMNGVLLLTGETPDEATRDLVLAHTKNLAELRQVLDEMSIAGKSALGSRLNDSWITSKVKTRMYRETGLDANRVKVVTEYGQVYLMGLVTKDEGHRAAESARTVGGVQRVVKVFEYLN